MINDQTYHDIKTFKWLSEMYMSNPDKLCDSEIKMMNELEQKYEGVDILQIIIDSYDQLFVKMLELKKYCPCGGIILADTEDWPIPMCYECYEFVCKEVLKKHRGDE